MITFLLDHCVWNDTESILSQAGFSCITLKKLGKTDATNGEVIDIARLKKSVLITRDRDFSNFTLYPLGSHEGIILLRITPKSMEAVHKVLLEALRTISPDSLKGNLLIVSSTTYRLHKHKQ